MNNQSSPSPEEYVLDPSKNLEVPVQLFRQLLDFVNTELQEEITYDTDIKTSFVDKRTGKVVTKKLTEKQLKSGNYERFLDINKTFESKIIPKISSKGLAIANIQLQLENIFTKAIETQGVHYSELNKEQPVEEEVEQEVTKLEVVK